MRIATVFPILVFTVLMVVSFIALAACSSGKSNEHKKTDDDFGGRGVILQTDDLAQPTDVSIAVEDEAVTALYDLAARSAVSSSEYRPLVKQRMLEVDQYSAPLSPVPLYGVEQGNENYLAIDENSIKRVLDSPVSTFSIDVDTASYSNVRRMLRSEGRLPPADAVKLEEMVNYFSYSYGAPDDLEQPFSVTTELAPSPWNSKKLLMQIGLKGYEPDTAERPAANLVFLVDVSGSMQSPNKLPLLKKSLGLLVRQMGEHDRIALVAYAGSAGLVLDSTLGTERSKIMNAIENLQAGGSTNGAAGIHLAYQVAEENLIEGGINRILIASDGDMNVGTSSVEGLKELIKEKRKTGIALTTLGFGSGNYNDAIIEQIADVGDGNAAYIDSLAEAQKVLVNEMQSTLLTIAKDVKIQVEFNPELVAEYRLLGYENRMLQREDFRNDKVDAGEIGAGHTVTALYEVTLKGSGEEMIPNLRYQSSEATEPQLGSAGFGSGEIGSGEIAYVNLRYKLPSQAQVETQVGNRSQEFGQAVTVESVQKTFDTSSSNLRFAAAVAAFGQLLRDSDYTQGMSFDQVLDIARNSRAEDHHGYRSEFLSLVELAKSLSTERIRIDSQLQEAS